MNMIYRGIDLSKHNGNVDFEKVKAAGIDFVILRAGFGKSIIQKDKRFEEYYSGAKKAGLYVGAYWFTYATNPATAAVEARVCAECLKGKQFEMPIYYDLEDDPSSNSYPLKTGIQNCSEMVRVFCSELENKNYWAGFYASRSVIQTLITPEVAKRYAVWVAEWGTKCKYAGDYGLWQYSETGRINGISGNVDLDFCYKDYPTAIKRLKLNGFDEDYRVIIEPFTKDDAEKYLASIKNKYPNSRIEKAR